jgi:hypothetical protein
VIEIHNAIRVIIMEEGRNNDFPKYLPEEIYECNKTIRVTR